MNDLPPGTTENPGTVNLSTTLDPGAYDAAVGQGRADLTPDKPEEPPKGESLRDVLNDEARKQDAASKPEGKGEEVKEDPKDKPEVKEKTEQKPIPKSAPNKGPDGRFTAKNEAAQAPQQGAREAPGPSEGEDDRTAPPARLTDEAKRYWGNVPRPVKAEVQRMEAELSRMDAESGPARQLHAELRDYDAMARQAGTSIKAALDKYTGFERAVSQDIGKGFAQIAQSQGKSPIETVASLLRAYGITPQQYAQHVTQNPQAHQVAPQAPRDPMVAQLSQQISQMQQMLQGQQQQTQAQAVQSEVQRWSEGRSDYQQLQPAIAEILKSGIIERIHGQGLSVVQKLDAAYRMAGGKAQPIVPQNENPASPKPEAAPSHAAGNPVDPGKLSVRGAPDDGLMPDAMDKLPLRDWLRKEMRKA